MHIRIALVLTVFTLAPVTVLAHETDQFTTPAGREFADLGEYFNRWAYDLIAGGVAHANADIRNSIARREGPGRLANMQDPGHLITCVHSSLPWSVQQIETFDRVLLSDEMWRRYPGRIVAYMEGDRNIYEHAFGPLDIRVFSRWWFAPTVKVYGTYLGTDKIGHFTELGVAYYWKWRGARERGEDEAQAIAEAVTVGTQGVMSEAGLLGTVANGDYANGDLAGNFAGFLFYRNLCEPTPIKGRLQPPMVVRDGPYWRLADHVRRDSDFFSIFISDHLDEALNPGFFDESMRPALREAVRKRSAAILWRYRGPDGRPRAREDFEAKLDELSTYWGIDYGHRGVGEELVSIANTCFESGEDPVASDAPNRSAFGRREALVSHPRHSLWRAVAMPARALRLKEVPPVSADPFHMTPLHLAAAASDRSLVRRLLANGASARASDDVGRQPLHEAARSGASEVVPLLIEAGADVNAVDAYGVTPLHLACRAGHARAVAALLAAGAAPDAKTAAGVTPLHEAALAGDADIARLLLAKGAARRVKDQCGRTPTEIAEARGYSSLAHLLDGTARASSSGTSR